MRCKRIAYRYPLKGKSKNKIDINSSFAQLIPYFYFMVGLVLAFHGTRDVEGNSACEQLFSVLARQLADKFKVERGYLEFNQPTIGEAIDSLASRGLVEITVIPVILLEAGHSKKDIPAIIREGAERHSKVRFKYARAFELHDQVVTSCESVIAAVRAQNFSQGLPSLIVVGRGTNEKAANDKVHELALKLSSPDYEKVMVAFAAVEKPTLLESLKELSAEGARFIIVMPFFLFTGLLVKRMIAQSAQFAEESGLSVVVAEPIGSCKGIATLLIEKAETAEDF